MPDFITADDLYNLEKCPRIVYLDHHGRQRDRLAPSDYQQWLMEQGAAFEQQVIAEHTLYQVPYLPDSPVTAFGLTLELMRRGAQLIYQGTLIYDHWQGRPDLLERVEGPSDLGDYHYRPVDIKSARQSSKQHRHQVMFYSFLLSHVQGVAPDGALLLRVPEEDGGGDDLTVEEPVAYSGAALQALLDEVETIVAGAAPPPFISSACSGCRWSQVCLPLAEEQRDVSLLSGLHRRSWRALHQRGLGTVDALARLSLDELLEIEGIGPGTAPRLLAHATAFLEGRAVPVDTPRLAAPCDGEVFFDIEGYSNGDVDCYYLMGLLVRRGGEYVFEYELAERPEGEREMWLRFLERIAPCGGPVYHYGAYEKTALRKLADRYGRDPRVQHLLERCVDLHAVVKSCVALPLSGYSLKQVAPWLGYQWSGATQAADDSILDYDHWLHTGDRQHLNHIISYNEDDVRATAVVRDWLLTLDSQH